MLLGLQGLRALAAFSVAISHSWDSPIRAASWFHGSVLVVDLFFILSGFMVTAAYGARDLDARAGADLVVARLGRLYPLHLFTLLLWLAIAFGKQGVQLVVQAAGYGAGMTPLAEQPQIFDAGYFLLSLVLLHGVGIVDSDLFNFAAWSISAEFWAFTTIVAVFATVPGRRARLAVIGMLIAVCAGWFAMDWWDPATGAFDTSIRLEKLLARSVLDYGVGVFALHAARRWLPRVRSASALGALQGLLLVAIALTVSNQPSLPWSQLWVLPLWAALVVSLGDDRGWLARVLGTRALVWLGERSYGIYMAHALIRMLYYHAQKHIPNADAPGTSALLLLPYLGLTVLFAHWLHTRVEMPAAAWTKAWLRGRRQPRALA
ncbi:MAG: acyltransferase family protein [Lautropia sp.]